MNKFLLGVLIGLAIILGLGLIIAFQVLLFYAINLVFSIWNIYPSLWQTISVQFILMILFGSGVKYSK
jgi:hypothetical protein